MRILLVEDDTILADALCRALVQSAYAVDVVADGEQADNALAIESYDLAILDIGLPGLSGLDVLRRLRARRSRVPVLLLTALDALADRVRGLDLGADDYLAKPFDLPELEARVRALLRRGGPTSTPFLAAWAASPGHRGPAGVLRRATGGALRTRALGARVAADARGPGGEQGAHGQPPVRVGRRGRRQCDRGLRLPHPQETRAPGMRDPHGPRDGLPDGTGRCGKAEPRLQSKLLAWLLGPLLALLVLDTVVTYWTSVDFSNLAYDRSLNEIAREVALHIKPNGAGPKLELRLPLPRESCCSIRTTGSPTRSGRRAAPSSAAIRKSRDLRGFPT